MLARHGLLLSLNQHAVITADKNQIAQNNQQVTALMEHRPSPSVTEGEIFGGVLAIGILAAGIHTYMARRRAARRV